MTEAIVKEEKKFGTDHVYLTLPNMTSEEAHKRFPNIFEACMDEGYDMTKDKVPVTPAQHYMMGGIQTDINGCTSMRHLYAAGETACNGVHRQEPTGQQQPAGEHGLCQAGSGFDRQGQGGEARL